MRSDARTPAPARTFSARIEAAEGGGAFVAVSFDVEAAYGRKRVPVKATIDGVAYRGSLVRMGTECHVLGVLKAIRERIGKQIGDLVEVTVEEDLEPRGVEMPADLRAAMDAAPGVSAAFAALSYSHQREYATWIAGAKRPETRERRVARAVEMIGRGERRR